MKRKFITSVALLVGVALFGNVQSISAQSGSERPYFNKKKDLLLAQFDSKPDPDDLHAQAALGCMMLHPDLKGVKIYAVSGAIGVQKGLFLDSRELFNTAFGKQWTAANEDWERAVSDILKVVKPIISKGGKVWVQEAGQSNITADWVKELLNTLSAKAIKEQVIVVQHSNWNEKMTAKEDLEYVKKMTTYFSIDDGNALPSEDWGDRGEYTTPAYRAKDAKWIVLAKEARNPKARKMWQLADQIIDSYFPNGFEHKWSYLHFDGVDYSDCCENWWILNIGEKADTHEKFWERYVTR
ncbi:MAG: hypothetical protein SNG14_00380 [Rikenellaceae bacterium]